MKSHMIALAAIAVLALGGCQPGKFFKKYEWTESKAVTHGWLPASDHALAPIYCYRTLADAVCHKWPVKGQESRLVGFAEPVPY